MNAERRLHRSMWKMDIQKLHLSVGIVTALAVAATVISAAPTLWEYQSQIIAGLLQLAGVPFLIDRSVPAQDLTTGIPLFYHPSGPTFFVPVEFRAMDIQTALVAGIVMLSAAYLVFRVRFWLPLKMLFLLILILALISVAYNVLASPVPPHDIRRLSLDWQFSGALILIVITLIFSAALFPLRGPLWIKFTWLGAVLAFSFVWNTVRFAVVLSTLFYTKSLFFLLLHYFAGVFVDFIYVVAIYSLALGHLARHETSEIGWTRVEGARP